MTTVINAQNGEKLPPIRMQQFTLSNGLKVILHQDNSTPIVAVSVWYHVGSKNEDTGKTGFAHLFEHMMFQGSKNYEDNYSKPLDEAGANLNGTTDEDRTYYYEVVPSNFLERALYLEADRMGGLLDAMSQEKLDNQRDVVKNERRQRIDNVPGGTASEKIQEIMYPKGHPYNWTPIGSMEDLTAASMDDVKGFFRKYYVPENAILVLSGDFDQKQAKTWIDKYFGTIAKGTTAINRPNTASPKLTGEIRKSYDDTVPFPRLNMVWHSVPLFAPDEAALDMLSSVLSQGRGSRLQSNIVFQKELAQTIFAFNNSSEIAGVFQLSATAARGKTLEDIEKEVNAEIERIKKDPPTAEEMARALNSVESQSIYGLQNALGLNGRISNYVGYKGQADYFQADLDRYRKVTAADVQRVANTYLGSDRLVMSFLPSKGGGTGSPRMNPDANKPSSTGEKKKDTAKLAEETARLPKPGPNPKFGLPPIQKAKLSNGLDVWIVQRHNLPIVSANLVLRSGGTLDPDDKAGVASFTSNMLNQGTKTRSANDIANQLQALGASVNANSSWDSSNVSMQTLTKNLDQTLDIFSDVVLNPAFPAAELESNRRRALNFLSARKANPGAVSDIVYNKVLYGNQPYSRQLSGDEKSVKTVTREDLVKFYEANYRPNNSTLIVVGDVDGKTLMPKLEKALGGWKSADVTLMNAPAAEMMGKPGIYLVDKPNAAQSSVSIGQVGVDRSNPDYYALQVMNSILGGGGSARLFNNLREDKGYTYGAYSRFQYRRGAGPFSASAEVQTAVTKESVVEFMKELNGIRGTIPVSATELEQNKQGIIRRYPSGFETIGQISGQLSSLVVYGLPDSYFNDFIQKINAVTVDDVNRVANKYLDPSKMSIVIVGDRKVIEDKLKTLGYSITIMDADGNPIAE
ncbi:MAG TPA: pitrilysin family protein [Pyrinomonadaceae bacterium]|jgi:zinc protease|nr:pitrilysin family protein [Pyrinomonadaceae bacterium]